MGKQEKNATPPPPKKQKKNSLLASAYDVLSRCPDIMCLVSFIIKLSSCRQWLNLCNV